MLLNVGLDTQLLPARATLYHALHNVQTSSKGLTDIPLDLAESGDEEENHRREKSEVVSKSQDSSPGDHLF